MFEKSNVSHCLFFSRKKWGVWFFLHFPMFRPFFYPDVQRIFWVSACSPVVPLPQTVARELVEVGGGATTINRSPPVILIEKSQRLDGGSGCLFFYFFLIIFPPFLLNLINMFFKWKMVFHQKIGSAAEHNFKHRDACKRKFWHDVQVARPEPFSDRVTKGFCR